MVSYSFYDSDNRVRRYAETLARERGYRVDAVCLRRRGLPAKDVIRGVNVYRVQYRERDEKNRAAYLGKMLVFFLRSMWFLTREHLKEPYDLIHVHSVPDFEVFAAWFPKLCGAKIILDIHDLVPEFYASKFKTSGNSRVFRWLVAVERASIRFADHVIAANHIWEKRLRERSAAGDKCTTILNFPDTRIFHQQGRRPNQGNKFILLYPGTLGYHQGLDIAIRAFSLIKAQVPEAEFRIYGDGSEGESLQALIAQLGLADWVTLRRSVPLENVARLIENADLGIVPKRNSGFGDEAFSTKVLEFMALGVPVIIPTTTIDRMYFNDSVAKFFDAEDERSLADAMLQLIGDRELRKRLIRNASEFVKNYTWEANQNCYLCLVDSLVHACDKTESAFPPITPIAYCPPPVYDPPGDASERAQPVVPEPPVFSLSRDPAKLAPPEQSADEPDLRI